MAVPMHDEPGPDGGAALTRLARLRLVPRPTAASRTAASRTAAPPAAAGLDGWCLPGVRSVPAAGPSRVVLDVQHSLQALRSVGATGTPEDTSLLLALAEQLRGLALRELAELDAVGAVGSCTSAAWLQETALLSDVAARSTVRLAVRLREDLPQLGALLQSGGTTVEHARAVMDGVAGLDRGVLRDSQDALCALVRSTDPTGVRLHLKERADAIRPELGREAARRAHDRRGFYADSIAGTRVGLGGSLDAEGGHVLLHGLDLACQADRTVGDDRTLPQRRADVLVQWAREAALRVAGPGDTLAQDAHSVRTHLLITCTPDQLDAAAGGTTGAAGRAAGGTSTGDPTCQADLGAPGTRPAGSPAPPARA